MAKDINPSDVEFVINNKDGTSTLGVGYEEPHPKNKGEFVHKIRNETVPRKEGNEIAKLLKKRHAEIDKIKRRSNGTPPPTRPIEREMRVLVTPGGRPISMDDLMKVKKRRSV